MRVLFAGLWARRGLNAAILLIAVTAISASVLGPMYGRASAEHLLDSRIAQRAPYVTGLSYALPALDAADLPIGSPDAYQPPNPDDLLAQASGPLRPAELDPYWAEPTRWLSDRGGTLQVGAKVFEEPLYWRAGMCRLAEVQGRCPQAAGEALIQQTMADTLGAAVGDELTLTFTDSWITAPTKKGPFGVEKDTPVDRTFTLVGTYTVPEPGSPAWFDLSRFTGIASLVPPPSKGAGALPAAPALLVAPASMTSQTFIAGVDRPIDPAQVDVDDMATVQRLADGYAREVAGTSTAADVDDLELGALFDEVRSEKALLAQVTLAALAPLVVLALLLLYALVSSAALIRRPYVALAKLRGHSRGQVLRFALAEPYLVVALAVPVGLGIAWGSALLVARTWLTPGIPVRLDTVATSALVVVTLAALGAAAAAALGVIREPLASALASSARTRPSSRWSLVLRSAVVAVAVAAVASLLGSGGASGGASEGSGGSGGQLLGLLAPLFIALATAIAGVWLLTWSTRIWVRRTSTRGGTPAYLASRRLARRQDLTKLMIPLLLAVSVITFAASASATADDWRVSRAKAEVGAARVFSANVSPGRLLRVTHQVDPEGRYVAAAAVGEVGDDTSRTVYVDTARLDRVAAWDPSWSDRSPEQLQQVLTSHDRDPITFTGARLSITVADVHLQSQQDDTQALWVQYTDDAGEQADVELGRLVNGSRKTLSASVPGCAEECTLEQIYLSGSASSVTDAQGSLVVEQVSIDGAVADWRLTDDGAWRAARPFPVSLLDPPVVPEAGPDGLRLRVYLGKLPAGDGPQRAMVSGYARITPSGTPAVLPAVVGAGTRTERPEPASSGLGLTVPGTVVGATLSGQPVPVKVVGTVRALPGLGDEGLMADLATSLVEFEPPPGQLLSVQLWAAPGTPASVIDAVRDAGVTLSAEQRVDRTLAALRGDAFSLGWRIFLIVGGLTLLLAVFGVLASAVAQTRWRSYEVASLRVVGVSQRSLVRASVLEYVVMLGCAVLLGLVAAYLSLRLVLPAIDLGNASDFDPLPSYATHWAVVAAVGLSLFVLATLIALGVSRRITRLGRPATLRWAEQG